jgi:hopanoid biosynthesis associated protein HpnK
MLVCSLCYTLPVPRLIVNADDFGLTSGINRAILELHQAGLLPSTTLMANAHATAQAVEIARATPTLGIGCHIVLIDGAPVLPYNQIPSLTNESTRRLHEKLSDFLTLHFTRHIQGIEIEAEARAQIQLLQKAGLRLTHIDTHKHTHMFPRVLRPVLRAARSCGITRVRNPFEPVWAVRATAAASPMRTAQVTLLRMLQSTWSRIIAEEGFTTTDGTIAVAGTGVLDAPTLRHLLQQVPDGAWELVTHPGYNDADLDRVSTRLRASRDIERKALSVLHEFPALNLISFGQLIPRA